jgi:hypothetical protein
VATEAVDSHGARNQDFAGYDYLASVHAGQGRYSANAVFAAPASWREDLVEPIRVGARIGEGKKQTLFVLSLEVRMTRHLT